jgi:hypothetical protein
MTFGPWTPASTSAVERVAQLRSLGALAAVYAGSSSLLVAALRDAESGDEAKAAAAFAALNQVPTRTWRELLSTFGAVTWPRPPRPSCAIDRANDPASADQTPDTQAECEIMKITCKKVQLLVRNTLRGFCEIHIAELDLVMRDVAVHEKNGSRWAQPPARPQLSKDGTAIKDEAGKIKYSQILEFGGRESRDRFSAAVVAAVLATEDGKRALGGQADADVPF